MDHEFVVRDLLFSTSSKLSEEGQVYLLLGCLADVAKRFEQTQEKGTACHNMLSPDSRSESLFKIMLVNPSM